MLPATSPLTGARSHAASRPTAIETVSATPSRQSAALPENKSTSVAPLEVTIKPRMASVPRPTLSRAHRLSHARNARTAVTVSQPSSGHDRSSALTTGPSISPRLRVDKEGSAKEPYPWSKGPDRLRDGQHCRGQGEPGDAIGHIDRWERWPGDSRLTRDVGKPDG